MPTPQSTTMVAVINLFGPLQIASTNPTTLYTVPASPATACLVLARARFVNTSMSNTTIICYGVPGGGAAGATNEFLPSTAVNAGMFVDVDIPLLGPGMFLQVVAGAANAITVSQMNGMLVS